MCAYLSAAVATTVLLFMYKESFTKLQNYNYDNKAIRIITLFFKTLENKRTRLKTKSILHENSLYIHIIISTLLFSNSSGFKRVLTFLFRIIGNK